MLSHPEFGVPIRQRVRQVGMCLRLVKDGLFRREGGASTSLHLDKHVLSASELPKLAELTYVITPNVNALTIRSRKDTLALEV